MCGRFAVLTLPAHVMDHFGLADIDDFPPRYNIAPTQPILVVKGKSSGGEPGTNLPSRRALLARWGLIPSWVKDPSDFPLLINARAETAEEKPSFRGPMRHHRILIPASGFYEWHRPGKESGQKSQAYWIRPRNGDLVAFAGLMQPYASADGSEVDTAAILTTGANRFIGQIHDRMPVVIRPEDFTRWLDCKTQEPRAVADLLAPVEDGYFEAIPIADLVNKVKNTAPDIQIPVGPPLSTDAVPTAAGGAQKSASPDDDDDQSSRQMSLF
ncbi:SOS response-associated peptidase [Rhizobium halophytocola]|uniref:Abasic site processing protein n=1 Tax=Rhizobium halophytocola TaxID=735519 RepID=A0ABS4DYP6_9HYPH|nr:SOS response-associated peptidase [Rhizobium halophytocola]MBP1850813.1 putative SOS response-associated peptidase YedK [Rhizobium halophytocola]